MNNSHYGLKDSDIPLLRVVQSGLLERAVTIPDWRNVDLEKQQRYTDQVRHILLPHVLLPELDGTAQRIADALTGMGLLQPFLRDPEVEEIYVRNEEMAIERNGRLERLGKVAEAWYWEHLIQRVAEREGRRLSPRFPAVLVDLPGGQRFTGMLPPLMDAPAINVRLFRQKARSFQALRSLGAFSPHTDSVQGEVEDILDEEQRASVAGLPPGSIERFLAWLVAAQAGNVLIAGEFSSGKTTLLNAMTGYIPRNAPVAVLETFRELQLDPSLFQMRAIAPSEIRSGEEERATMDWVLNVVYTRANPAAIILGEIVSRGEAMQFLQAANLGRRAYATIHGATVRSALGRLEQLALGYQPDMGLAPLRQMVVGGVNVVVLMARQLHQAGAHRFIARVAHLRGLDEHGEYVLETIYSGREKPQSLDVLLEARKRL